MLENNIQRAEKISIYRVDIAYHAVNNRSCCNDLLDRRQISFNNTIAIC
jgi:hypothetical protein